MRTDETKSLVSLLKINSGMVFSNCLVHMNHKNVPSLEEWKIIIDFEWETQYFSPSFFRVMNYFTILNQLTFLLANFIKINFWCYGMWRLNISYRKKLANWNMTFVRRIYTCRLTHLCEIIMQQNTISTLISMYWEMQFAFWRKWVWNKKLLIPYAVVPFKNTLEKEIL